MCENDQIFASIDKVVRLSYFFGVSQNKLNDLGVRKFKRPRSIANDFVALSIGEIGCCGKLFERQAAVVPFGSLLMLAFKQWNQWLNHLVRSEWHYHEITWSIRPMFGGVFASSIEHSASLTPFL